MMNALQELTPRSLKRETLVNAITTIFTENESILPIIYSLKRQGKKLLLLSNTNELHFNFIQRHFPWIKLFDAAILSYEVKEAKPQPAIYQAALKAAGFPPYECFYVDDIPSHVEAARQMGIDAELYQDAETLRHHLAQRMVFV
jgi:putative hydrolase of the HAD superfamily